jgi:DNA modification methylase
MPRRKRPSVRTLADLTPDPSNANRGTARGQEALDRSLRELGAGRAIVIDRAGRIIAGNKTADRARRLGLRLRVVRTDGRHLVAVQRSDLDLATDPRARHLAIADNRVGELDLAWDVDVLRQLHEAGSDLSAWWTPEEFAALVDGTGASGHTDENAVVAPGPTTIRPSDLFQLGRHRLLCGDATVAADVGRLLEGRRPLLMVTDPPYGVAYDPAWRHRVNPAQRTAVGRVANDDRVEWTDAFTLFPGSIAYVWHAGLQAGTVAAHLTAAGFTLRNQIIWRKQHFVLSRGEYHWAHEPCWYAVRRTGTWRGDRTQTTVWDVPNLNPMGGTRSGENTVTGHATQKPVRLFELPMLNHTTTSGVVYDPFCGSGTALIAAEKTGRTCYAMEVDPRYVHVTITRWEQFTRQRATRIAGPTTRPRTS